MDPMHELAQLTPFLTLFRMWGGGGGGGAFDARANFDFLKISDNLR